MLAQNAALVNALLVRPWNKPRAHGTGVVCEAGIVDAEARRSTAQIPENEYR